MSLIQLLYFVLAALTMGGVGVALLTPPLRAKKFEQVFTRMMVAFAAKLLIGIGFMVLALKILGWTTMLTAFGMVTAYVAALIIVTVAAMLTVKQGQR